MGYLLPTLLAFGLNACGVYIFQDHSKAGCEPLISSLIFLFGVFLLLWDLRLFPCSLRSLVQYAAITMHFFLSAFFMEHIMNDFWYPLEASLFTVMPKVADYESRVLKQFGWRGHGILQILKSRVAHVLASYALSLFFLVTVMHATRVIDLRILRCGKDIFFEDLAFRMRRALRRLHKKYAKKKSKNSDCGCDDDDGGRSRFRKGYC